MCTVDVQTAGIPRSKRVRMDQLSAERRWNQCSSDGLHRWLWRNRGGRSRGAPAAFAKSEGGFLYERNEKVLYAEDHVVSFDVSLCSAAELHSSASDAGRSGFNYCVQIGRRYDRCDCNSESI